MSLNVCKTIPRNSFLGVAVTLCETSYITSIQPYQGSALDEIIIKGTGFTDKNCVTIHVKDKECHIKSMTTDGQGESTFKCIVNATMTGTNANRSPDPLLVGPQYEIQVRNGPIGLAILKGESFLGKNRNRAWRLLPHVTSVSPSEGSLQGDAVITITGGGFVAGATVVDLGSVNCTVINVTYTEVTCRTSAFTGGNSYAYPIKVYAYQFASVCHAASGNCQYTMNAQNTPTITNISPNTITTDPTTLTITGTGFDASGVEVTIGEDDCVVTSSSNTEVVCDVPGAAEGSNDVIIKVPSKGAQATPSTTINGTFMASPTISPSTGGTGGETLVTIGGHGFVRMGSTPLAANVLSVMVDNTACTLVRSTHSELVFKAPVLSPGTYDIDVINAGSAHIAIGTFTVDAALTPTISAMNPAQGGTGTVIQITGTGLSATPDENEVSLKSTSGDVVDCQITASSTTVISCELPEAATGQYTASVYVAGSGMALWSSTSAIFTYEMSVTSISPNTGSHMGGMELTISGAGLSQLAAFVIDSNACTKVQGTTSQLTCITPPSTAGSGSVAVDFSWDSMTTTVPFTYTDVDTPEVTSPINPVLGGTGGGTVLTIPGTGFTPGATIKLVGGGTPPRVSDCTPLNIIATQILCTTPAHALSEDVDVVINVPGKGLAAGAPGILNWKYANLWSSPYTWGAVKDASGNPIYSSGGKPTLGDVVSIPTGQTVVLDEDTPTLKMVLINGGELIFSDDVDVTLRAENIMITSGGLLQIGTESDPHQHEAVIEMVGHLRSVELPIFGAKTLAVREGTLEMHGRHIAHPWTMLAATANIGDTTIDVQDSVNDWRSGDVIAIATTGDFKSQKETEVKEIVSINGNTITLNDTLSYRHMGISETHNGLNLDIRAEVGLLTRNIRFRGIGRPEWEVPIPACDEEIDLGQFATQTCFLGKFGDEIGSDQFGGAIMFAGEELNTGKVVGHLEHVELTYVGQAFRLGRYPIHFHINGNMNGSYVKGCSIHQTFNRAINIHHTDNLLIEGNVIFNVMGGAMFLEDGIETGNVFRNNLALKVLSSSSLLNDDVTPAAFWGTHPTNHYYGNHVAGGSHFGFWFRFHEHPDGPSFDPNICPRNAHNGDFENNVVHSCGWYGLWIFEDYYPTESGNCQNKHNPEPFKPAIYNTLYAYNNKRGAETVQTGPIQFHGFVVANNDLAGIERSFIQHGTLLYDVDNGASAKNCTIIGHYNYPGHPDCSQRGTVIPFNNGYIEDGTTFVNFDAAEPANKGVKCAAIGMVSITCVCSAHCGAYEYWFSNTNFINCDHRSQSQWEFQHELVDVDGTMSNGAPGSRILTGSPLNPPGCTVSPLWSLNGIDGVICPPGTDFIRGTINSYLPEQITYMDLMATNNFGTTSLVYSKQRSTNKQGHFVLFPAGKDGNENPLNLEFANSSQIVNISYAATFMGVGSDDDAIICHPLIRNGPFDQVQVFHDVLVNGSDSMLTYGGNKDGDWYYEQTPNTKVCYMLKGDPTEEALIPNNILSKTQYVSFAGVECLFKDCIVPDPSDGPIMPDTPELWSDSTIWNTVDEFFVWTLANGTAGAANTKPAADSIVKIKQGYWIRLDEQPPKLYKLIVNGAFDVLNDAATDFTLEATYIVVDGIFNVGVEGAPFNGSFTISLHGDPTVPDYRDTITEPVDGPILGNKAMGIYGDLNMNGIAPSVYWTALAETVLPGVTSVKVQEPVAWAVGDQIVIATTSFEATENEVVEITSVSSDGLTLGITPALQYHHIGALATGSETINGHTYNMGAEVGLLTRNIKIKGFDGDVANSFGARVLIGLKTDLSLEIPVGLVGAGRIENVEFAFTGQEGFTTSYDPRFSLAFVQTGPGGSGDTRPSYVKGCSFHHGFSTAIGIFGSSGLVIKDNVIHRTAGPSIQADGSDFAFIHNLAIQSMFVGAWRGRNDIGNFKWHGAIDLTNSKSYKLIDNTVAGSEKAAFRLHGESCSNSPNFKANDPNDDEVYRGNKAHTVMAGLLLFKDDCLKDEGCSLFRNFFVYKSYNYAYYATGSCSIEYDSIMVADSHTGVLNMLSEPDLEEHKREIKTVTITNSLFIGQSPSYDCAHLSEPDPDSIIVFSGMSGKANCLSSAKYNGIDVCDGMIAINPPTRTSSPLKPPLKPFALPKSQPAHGSKQFVNNCTFAHFNKGCHSLNNVIIGANSASADFEFPIYFKQSFTHNVDLTAVSRIIRPRASSVNIGTCGDLACDARNKNHFVDLDGKLLGGSKGCLIPDSAHDWAPIPGESTNHIDPTFGLGYYRVSRELKTRLDGSLINEEDMINSRGVYHEGCTYINDWQAYHCPDIDYSFLVWEGLDPDFITRRVGPMSVYEVDGQYMDVVNGPRSIGICHGYACLRRANWFPLLLKDKHEYRIYPSGTPYQQSTMYRITHDPNSFSIACVYFGGLTRMDVFDHNDNYVLPANAIQNNGRISYDQNKNRVLVIGALKTTPVHGVNFYSYDYKEVCVRLNGEDPISFRLQQVVILGLNMPSITFAEFYDPEHILANVAAILSVPLSSVRVANAVDEGGAASTRKKRATAMIHFDIEIGNHPALAGQTLSLSDLDRVIDILQKSIDGGTLATDLNMPKITVNGNVIGYIPTFGSPEWDKLVNGTDTVTTVTPEPSSTSKTQGPTQKPGDPHPPTGGNPGSTKSPGDGGFTPLYKMDISTPSVVTEGLGFATRIYVRNDRNELVTDVSGSVTISLIITDKVHAVAKEATLEGIKIASFKDGVATFPNIYISRPGNDFAILAEGAPRTLLGSATFEGIDVESRQLKPMVPDLGRIKSNELFTLTTHLMDSSTGTDATKLDWSGLSFKAMARLDTSVPVSGSLSGSMQGNFSSSGSTADLELMLDKAGHYAVIVDVISSPMVYAMQISVHVEVVGDSKELEVLIEKVVPVEMTFMEDYSLVEGKEQSFTAALLNGLNLPTDVIVGDINLFAGSIVVEFTLAGSNASVDAALKKISSYVSSSCKTVYDEQTLLCDAKSLKVSGKEYQGDKSDDSIHLAILIAVPIAAIILISIIVIILVYCFCKPNHYEEENKLTPEELQGLKNLMEAASRPSSGISGKGSDVCFTPDYSRENTGFTHKSADQLLWNSNKGEYRNPGDRKLSIGDLSKQGTFITLSTRSDAELDSRPTSAVSRPTSAISKQDIVTCITPRDTMTSRTSFSVPSVDDC